MSRSDFRNPRDQLRALSAHLRDPNHYSCPESFDGKAAGLYRELLVGNFDAALRACFPLWIRCLGESAYLRWRDAFIAEHRCRSPFFRQIPDEFMAYLSQHQDQLRQTLPYALELAHLEWLELALGVAETEERPEDTENSEAQDPWTGALQLNPVHALVQYAYPVQQLLQEPRFSAAPVLDPQTVSLYLYRDRDDIVQMLEPDTLSLHLLVTLEVHPQPGAALFQNWQENGQMDGDTQAFAGQLHQRLRQMLDLQMIQRLDPDD
ncbi:DUF2063 domain-containing protein [Acidithiobacillus sp. M4-SHS-6]|uniref:HvfC family RiPP maturation protein n=1 Tax=Acidithiobacillus sp. M4-SHS-6 TaxID=3383024 RepID=UPI0039BE2AAD